MDLIDKALSYQNKYQFAVSALGRKRGALSKVATAEGTTTDTIKKHLRLLNLPSEVQANIRAGRIKIAEALIIERLPSDRQIEIAEYYIDRKLTRKRLLDIVNGILSGRPDRASLLKIDINIKKELDRLIESLGFFIDESLTTDSIMIIKSWDEELVKHLFLVRPSVSNYDYSLDISIPSSNRFQRQGIKLTFELSGMPGKDDIGTLICQIFRRVEALRAKISNQ